MKETTGTKMESVDALRQIVETRLSTLVTQVEPGDLYEPVKYVLEGGGKRLRPVIVLMTARGFGVSPPNALPAALAVEVFHNFTLVHDDIMDRSDERRGRPTVHRKWNQDIAILAGDYLMALSYHLLAAGPPDVLPEMMSVFGKMVRRLCEGQTLDKAFESRKEVSVGEYFEMIDAKTGALLEACLELGAVIGGASAEERGALRDAGIFVGRAFQIQDDLLDVIAVDDRWGKRIGGDLVEAKRTYLLLRCLEALKGSDRAWFQQIIDDGRLAPDLVPEARARMSSAGIIAEARVEVERYTKRAAERLRSLPDRSLQEVADLFSEMMVRRH